MLGLGGRVSLRGDLGFVILLIFVHVNFGYAQAAKEPEKQCGDYGTQSAMNECAAREAHKAEDALNSAYRDLLNKLTGDKTATARVVAAENAWMAFRDAELAADWPVPDGENPNLLYGSVHPFCYYNERTALTLARLKTLSDRMQHEGEGDICSTSIASLRDHHDPQRRFDSALTKQLAHGVPGE
jgi:uncharacterized protein YecT (DUF1311 family)